MNPIALTPAQRKKLDDLINSGRIRRVPADLAKADRFIAQSRDASQNYRQLRIPSCATTADITRPMMSARR